MVAFTSGTEQVAGSRHRRPNFFWRPWTSAGEPSSWPRRPRAVGGPPCLQRHLAQTGELPGPCDVKSPTVSAAAERLCRGVANLLAVEAAVGVRHHVSLSVVGVERLREEGYFRAPHAQEELIRRSPMPYSITRTTQLFESVGDIADAATEDWIIWLAPAQIQPVSCADVATSAFTGDQDRGRGGRFQERSFSGLRTTQTCATRWSVTSRLMTAATWRP
ncbi:hypothetical protein SAMN04490356_8479 [Streptomyces melanosporofaciens]|uniref:NAD(P)H-binding n=1 Tax=Streptomyces melanosporofaciens TaxID=67327 RepID=A0A1H5AQF3_STRMJ|nr:hypothetical protein SAMN04490356_8479 [Streptomyces melanosporofaciens]